MSNTTSVVIARIDSALKDEAEAILAGLGVSPSSLIEMTYRQVVLHHGIPFDVPGPECLVCEKELTDEDITGIIAERLKTYGEDKEYSKDEFHRMLEEKYGI